MRILWTLLKVIIGLAIAIPLGILALALTVGVVGTLVGLAFLALKLAVVGFLGYGAFRLLRAMFAPSPKLSAPAMRELPEADPYYNAAMRELDSELGIKSR
jgi:threonine/homoserine/homoserine lactone efflux protein